MSDFVARYVITRRVDGEMRTLMGPVQGRDTFATREEADAVLDTIQANNTPERLHEVGADNLEVRWCPCWPVHFDPKRIYFFDPLNPKVQP